MPEFHSAGEKRYDLAERTAKFGEEIIVFCREIKKDVITIPLVNQLIRCGTSVGANYCEADDAESRKDFKHKIGISKKEARETEYFLRMMAIALPEKKDRIYDLQLEAHELNLIFNVIYQKVKE